MKKDWTSQVRNHPSPPVKMVPFGKKLLNICIVLLYDKCYFGQNIQNDPMVPIAKMISHALVHRTPKTEVDVSVSWFLLRDECVKRLLGFGDKLGIVL